MVVLALIPSISVLTVSARSASAGFVHGVFTTIGIVVGDIVYILLAIYGLAVLADLMGSNFFLVKYIGGAYLIWLGVTLWQSRPRVEAGNVVVETSLLSSFLAGLLITLGDQKVILFYLGFFPAFIDLSVVSLVDTGIVIMIVIVAVGGAKLVYAYMAARAGLFLRNSRAYKGINITAGSVMIVVGVLLFFKA